MTNQQIMISVGIRRSRNQQTLDVTFLKPQQISINDLNQLDFDLPVENGFMLLTKQELESLSHHFVQLTSISEDFTEGVAQIASQSGATRTNDYHDIDNILMILHDSSQAVGSAEEAYFKLHCLSFRIVEPHQVSMDGAFGQLTNVAWSNLGPLLPEDVPEIRLSALAKGENLQISHLDKFPYLVNYHLPSGVRIASGNRVRLGAYLGEGTTVMPAGYVNFNAGSSGTAMIEGRVSAGVFIGDDTDIGGGASIMGTLSGGNEHVIEIKENCLLGANAGVGISLGKGCTIEAGLYITAGMKIALVNQASQPVDLEGDVVAAGQNIFKALDLSGRDNCLFIRDSRTGQIICKPNTKVISLNESLHDN